jgi:PAS domain S-box-containing protein
VLISLTIFDEEDTIVCDGILMDVTERKKAGAALAESERKQRFVFDNTKDVFRILDLEQSKITFIGGANDEMYGYTSEEIKKQPPLNHFDPKDASELIGLIMEKTEKYYQTGVVQHFQVEKQHIRKDGSKFWVETSLQLVPDEDGKITQMVGIDRNIEERKKAETMIAESERKFRLISDNVKDVFWIADFDTLKYTFFSGSSFEMIGYTSDELMQMTLNDILAPQFKNDRSITINKIVEKYNETGIIEPISREVLALRKDGLETWLETRMQILADENGKLSQIVGVTRTIDERKK